MRWLRRRRQDPFPADMVARMDLFGRFEMDKFNSGIASEEIWPICVGPFHEFARDHPDRFLAALRALVRGHENSFAVYGAARLVWELLGSAGIARPDAWPLVDAGIDFKLARNLSNLSLAFYEQERLAERRRNDSSVR